MGTAAKKIGSESPQDVVIVNGVGAGDIISFEVAHPGQSLPSPATNITPIDVDFQGLAGTGTPSPDPVTVSQGGAAQTASYTVTTADASDGVSRFLIQIDETPNPPPTNYARVSYKLSCEKGDKGRININKKIIGGDGSTAFEFSGNENFSLTPLADGTDSKSFELDPGTYSVTEFGPPAGWTLTGLSCEVTDGSSSTTSTAGATATIGLVAGETVECTYTNTGQQAGTGSITIVKETINGDGEFSFDAEPEPLSDFTIDTAVEITKVFPNLSTETTYTFTEKDLPPGWKLTNVQCTGGTNVSENVSQDGSSGTATIGLSAGENVVCTFTNTKQDVAETGTIIIQKRTVNGDGTTTFDSSGGLGSFGLTPDLANGTDQKSFGDVSVGQYVVTDAPKAGWTTSASCRESSSDGQSSTVNGASATINLDPDEVVICTFVNTKKVDDRASEETKRFVNRRVDNLLTYRPDRARMLRRLGEGPPPPVSLKDGPMKLNGATSAASSASRTGGMPGLFGSRSASSGSMALGANPFGTGIDQGNVIDNANADAQSQSGPTSTSTGILSHIAGQLMPLAQDSGSIRFSTSLSEMRAAATAAEEKRQRDLMMKAGLNYAEQPYVSPSTGLRPGFDVWVEGHIARYNDDLGVVNRDGDFSILYVGADYVIAPGVLIGALVQVDDTDETIDDLSLKGNIDGTGWMAGPYIGLRLADNLYFDAGAAWGQSDNDIDLTDAALGRRTGSFDTDRWLASATLTGNEYYGASRFTPQVGIAHGEEDYGAYSTSLKQDVPGGGASIGRVTGTMEIGYRFDGLYGSSIEPHVAVSGIWNFDSDDLYVNGVLADTDESRARVEGGLLITTPSGIGLRAAAAYDGIGAADFEAVSGSLWINVPLN